MSWRWMMAWLFVVVLNASAVASPLDDRIKAYNDATAVQDQNAVTQILKLGVQENRSAEAMAAVQPWLNRNSLSNNDGLFYAGQAAERSGQYLDAIGYYQRLLLSDKLNANQAGDAADATYRLLINIIGDENAAYQFMRKDGNRIRSFGKAKRYDNWFLDRAKKQRDLVAVAERLKNIASSKATKLDDFDSVFVWLCTELEHFREEPAEVYAAAMNLAEQKRTPAEYKARLNWVVTVMPYNMKLDELREANTPAAPKLTDEPLAAADQLIKTLPNEGPLLVAKGWGTEYDHVHSGNCLERFNVEGERKLKQLLDHVPRMSADRRDDLLAYPIAQGRVRFDPAAVHPLVLKYPGMLNGLDVANVPLFDKATMTVDLAQKLAPLLARNPHEDAALIRGIAAASSLAVADVTKAMFKTEAWRFDSARRIADLAWHNCSTEEADRNQLIKQFDSLGDRQATLREQVSAKANGKQRMAAFKLLLRDLTSDAPSVPGAWPLWEDLFKQAPPEDGIEMLSILVTDLKRDRDHLLRRVVLDVNLGGGRRMDWRADPGGGFDRHHRGAILRHAGPFTAAAREQLKAQAKAGELTPWLFGLWLHSAETGAKAEREFFKQLLDTPAYQKLDRAYRLAASESRRFGDLALTDDLAADHPGRISQPLLELGPDAKPADVQAALRSALDRAAAAPEPVAVIGLDRVAELPDWSDTTLSQVLSLFQDHAPLGAYPSRQGYEKLLARLSKELVQAEHFDAAEPYAAGLWAAAGATDDNRYFRGAAALIGLAEAALDADQTSVALSLARSGSSSRAAQAMDNRNLSELLGRLSQVQGKTSIALGIIEIPVDELDPAYPIYKSQAEFALGNLDAAWELYAKHADKVSPVIRELTVPYCLWLLERDIEARESDRAEALIKELTVWSRQQSGTFTPTQEGELKIAYADAAFQKGALQTAKAWYRRVADSDEFKGQPLQYEAQLRSVRVDRAGKDFDSALAELDKLMLVRDQELRTKVHFARAEVFYDQERYADAFNEASAVLKREPAHPDALILLGQAQLEMRKLVDASEIELGVSQDQKLIVPGEVIKINLSDPALNISGVGADIEVEVWTKSGDRERVMLYQLGDDKTKFRAEIPTTLGKRQPGDKVLQILGRDEIRYGYSERFREKMADLPDDPEVVIGVASDAHLSASAGAFPPREGERKLDLSVLGVSSAQQALGTRQVRPGNPVYLRITDPDQSKTDGIDQIAASIETSSGDMIPRLVLDETGPYTGEFEIAIPTAPAQALAYASESAPGRDANMVISAENYPGWSGEVGSKAASQSLTVDLYDNVPLGKMTLKSDPTQAPTHFVIQTSLNGADWQTTARYPKNPAPWSGKPQVTAFPTKGHGLAVSNLEDRTLPTDWQWKMDALSAGSEVRYNAFEVEGQPKFDKDLPHGGRTHYPVLVRYRALFYQPESAIRTFRLAGLKPGPETLFFINGKPAAGDADDPYTIQRELKAGIHQIEFWRHESLDDLKEGKPLLLCDVPGQKVLQPCLDEMFDPATFPEALRQTIPEPTSVTTSGDDAGRFEIAFGKRSRARAVRLVILEHRGPTPMIQKITLTDHDGDKRLPVAQDYNKLRANGQLEVVPGDRITVRYEDDRVLKDRHKIQQQSLSVAYNTATIAASFLTYEMNREGERELIIEPIRRFKMDDNVGLVVNDPDLDQTPERDELMLTVKSSSGETVEVIALETGEHTGKFLGKVFPITGEPTRDSEVSVPPSGTITAIYRDRENLEPGIPTDRTVTIEHARFQTPGLAVYDTLSTALPTPKRDDPDEEDDNERGPEVVKPRQSLNFVYLGLDALKQAKPKAVIGSTMRFDVIASHLAFALSSEIVAYVQTESGRRKHKANGEADTNAPFDIRVPGTMRLMTTPSRSAEHISPAGYTLAGSAQPPHSREPLDEGRFAFAVPIQLGLTPSQSFATQDAQTLPRSMRPDALAVRPGDTVHIGFAYLDEQGKPQWLTTSVALDSYAFIDVMNGRYRKDISSAFVGEKLFVRVIAPDQDKTPERDEITVTLQAKSGVSVPYMLRESEVHSGVFKGSFGLTYASDIEGTKLPSVALHGLPVKYGDTVTVSYENPSRSPIAWEFTVNKGADGSIEPFTKQYGDGAVAVQTTFTLAECFFELAKHHRKMEEESLARRQMGHAQKLLAEAIATHHDENMQAHAEYLLGNLAQEYADLSENEASKKQMYQDALARFTKIPLDYPDSEFAPKAQFKKGLVYEKLGEVDIAVEEYVKLAYKYPEHELIPSVMSRLGSYFQAQGKVYKDQAEALEQDENNTEALGEAIKLREKMTNEYRNAAQVFKKLQDRFPNDPLAGLAGLRSAQNYLRAGDYRDAIDGFQIVIDTEEYDGKTIRSQAMFWAGISYERLSEPNQAYQLYRRTTFDFPDSVWAKQARGRLSDPVFAKIIEAEQAARERMLEALRDQ